MQTKRKEQTKKLALMALLTALVAVLSYLGGFIKFGLASLSLTLIPVVMGAVLYGPWSGTWLGAVSAIAFLPTPDGLWWLGMNTVVTIVIVLLKALVSGFCAGLIYKLLARYNDDFAVVMSAIAAPVLNTGIFLIGCLMFFPGVISTIVVANFCLELIANVILCPSIYRIIKIKGKKV